MKYWSIIWIGIIQGVRSLVVHQGVFSHLTVQISPDVPQPANCQSFFRQIEVNPIVCFQRRSVLNRLCVAYMPLNKNILTIES